SDRHDRLRRGNFQPVAARSQDSASRRGRSLVEGNGLGARHLRILPRSGRPMDARSARQRNRAQPVWREKLDFEGGQLAGSSPSRRRGKFTTEKCKQTENTKNMNKQTQATSNDMGQLAEDAR